MKQPGQEKDGRKTEIKALIGPAAAIYEPIGEPVSTGLSISRPISRPISPLIFIYFLFSLGLIFLIIGLSFHSLIFLCDNFPRND